MKSTHLFLIILFLSIFTSCSNKNSLCYQGQSIEALKASLIESVSKQSEFLEREYGLTQVDVQLETLFKENKIQLSDIYSMNTTQVDSMLVCNCGGKIFFADDGKFLKSIEPIVSETKKIDDKYSSAFIKNEHLLKYSEKEYYPFFFSVFQENQNVSASENDYKVASLLIDFLKANKNS